MIFRSRRGLFFFFLNIVSGNTIFFNRFASNWVKVKPMEIFCGS